MSDAMMWTFGFLAFFILLVAVTKIPRRSPLAALGQATSNKQQELTNDQLRTISEQLTELQQRMDSMERILKEVE